MDDTTESSRKLVKLGDMPAVDLSMDVNANGIGENLEAEDDDEPEPMQIDPAKPAQTVEVEEEEDPLDAFMSGVKEEVKKVNAEDRKRMAGNGEQLGIIAEDAEDDMEETRDVDELDATELRPEDILACVCSISRSLRILTLDTIVWPPKRPRKRIWPLSTMIESTTSHSERHFTTHLPMSRL
jgi:ATP-dependent RNA helicase DDX46/PRP5